MSASPLPAQLATPDTPAQARPVGSDVARLVPWILLAATFLLLFWRPAMLLGRDWWNDPESGHGLLLAPVSLWLAWKAGLRPDRSPSVALGTLLLVGAVLIRGASELAAELFTMRMSMVMALGGLVVYYWGLRQALAWWLPFTLLVLSVPLPELLRSGLALPLQFQASEMGAALLEWRQIPVHLSGNVLSIPGHRLFVTEACSGLRSLTALLSLGVLIGGLWLRHPVSRILLIALAIPVAIVVNGVRVFLTGFLVFFVDPSLGEGFMHVTEGWLLFLVSFLLVGGVAALVRSAEGALARRRHAAA